MLPTIGPIHVVVIHLMRLKLLVLETCPSHRLQVAIIHVCIPHYNNRLSNNIMKFPDWYDFSSDTYRYLLIGKIHSGFVRVFPWSKSVVAHETIITFKTPCDSQNFWVTPRKKDNSKIKISKIDKYCQTEMIYNRVIDPTLFLVLVLLLHWHFISFVTDLGNSQILVGQIADQMRPWLEQKLFTLLLQHLPVVADKWWRIQPSLNSLFITRHVHSIWQHCMSAGQIGCFGYWLLRTNLLEETNCLYVFLSQFNGISKSGA